MSRRADTARDPARGTDDPHDAFRMKPVEPPDRGDTLAGLGRRLQASAEAIGGIADLLLQADASPDRGMDGVELLLGTSDAVCNAAHDLLDLARIESDRFVLDDVSFALRPCLQDVLVSLARRARARRLRLELRLSPTAPDDLIGDPGRLRQVVRSLVGHALSHAREGEVTLAVDAGPATSGYATLSFEIVSRAIESTVGRGADAADPRSIARDPEAALGCRVASLMGGSVMVGRRSRGEVTIALAMPFRSPEAARDPEPAASFVGGRRVLVTGERDDRFAALCDELSMLGLDLVACSRDEARVRLEAPRDPVAPLDAVVLCVSDDEPLDREPLLASGARTRAPIVVVTASGRRGDAHVLRDLGVAGYLTGLPSRTDLAETLRAVLAPANRGGTLVTRHTLREARSLLRVLVCAGDVLGRCIAARVLERRGHSVLVLEDAAAAVDVLAADGFDAVVVDTSRDRASVARAAVASRERRIERGSGLTLVSLTSGPKHDGRTSRPAPEADAWLEMPIDAARLVEVVETIDPSISRTPPRRETEREALVDLDAALERAGGDRALVADLAETLIVDARERVRTMRQAVDRGDHRAIESAAHAIRSSLGVFGADSVLEVATRLEAAGRAGDLAASSEILAELVAAIGRLEPALREIAAGGGSR